MIHLAFDHEFSSPDALAKSVAEEGAALAALGEEINKKLGTKHVKFHVFFIPVSRGDLIPALLAGRGDLAASGITVTPERAEQVDFTRPTWDGVNEIVVTGPASPPLASLDDLAGKSVFVISTSAVSPMPETGAKSLAGS